MERNLHARLCLFLLLALNGSLFAQQTSILPVHGRITDGDKKLDGCEVIIFEGNEQVSSQTTDRSGRFGVGLELEKEYALEFRREGFVPKRIVIDTRAKLEDGLIFSPLVMDVSMLLASKYEGADTDVLDFPFAIVRYDKKANAFIQDPTYTAGMIRANGALLLMAGRASKER